MTTEELYMHIGRKIRMHRTREGLTQEALSQRTGISLSFLGHIERGTRKLSVDTLYKLACALQCSVNELMEIENASALDINQCMILNLEEIIDFLRTDASEP